MTALTALARRSLARASLPLRSGLGRLSQYGPRPPRFAGAYASVAEALAAVPPSRLAGYDHDAAVDVSLEAMTQVHLWDYPVLFWLDRLLKPGAVVLDVGGHLATKPTAFARLLDLSDMSWIIQDLPAVVSRGKALQAAGRVPPQVSFRESLVGCPRPDVLLASGLLQYLDRPFPELLRQLPGRPGAILLNKVAMRNGPEVVTLERIGPARVPYRIRNRAGFEAELAVLGYRTADHWSIPQLSHRITTHPGLGRSESRGMALIDLSS
ncbi:MAG: methyltransferase, family [Cereibacter sp.]|jgi:putative methyltransferase (TIGR04325 family)|nr:methyltransferase, family [Cereibacter sp.]